MGALRGLEGHCLAVGHEERTSCTWVGEREERLKTRIAGRGA